MSYISILPVYHRISHDLLNDCVGRMETPPGFEPGNQGFADLCLTRLGYGVKKNTRTKRDQYRSGGYSAAIIAEA